MNLALLDPFILAQDCPEAFIGGLSMPQLSPTWQTLANNAEGVGIRPVCASAVEETTLARAGYEEITTAFQAIY